MIYGNGHENSLIHGKTAKLKLQLFIFPFHIIIANLESFLNQQKDVKNCYVKQEKNIANHHLHHALMTYFF